MGGASRMHGRELRERGAMAGRFVPGAFDLAAEGGGRRDRLRRPCCAARLVAGAGARTGGA